MMRNLRNSAMELGETRQLVIPCQRCGESRVILAKQGCDSNTLFELMLVGDQVLHGVQCTFGIQEKCSSVTTFWPASLETSLANVSSRACRRCKGKS